MSRSEQNTFKVLPWLLLVATFIASTQVFMPFVQQEAVGQAEVWSQANSGFWERFFNCQSMDGGADRFRYLEYLSEAAYWKSFQMGWLPRSLYDWWAIFLGPLMAYLIYKIARNRGSTVILAFLCASVFLLSTPSVMVGVWNYRKAKYLTTLLLLLLFEILTRKPRELSQVRAIAIAVLSFAGFLLDPYFVLFAPLAVAALEWADFKKLGKATFSVVTGYMIAIAVVIFANITWIPLLHPECNFVLSHIPQVSEGYLSIANFKYFYDLPLQLLLIYWQRDRNPFVAEVLGYSLLTLSMAGSLWCCIQKRLKYPFIFILPLIAASNLFLFSTGPGRYTGYYGHTLFAFFVLAYVEILKSLSSHLAFQRIATFFLMLILFFQVKARGKIYKDGLATHTGSVLTKYQRDYADIAFYEKRIAEGKFPIYMPLDYSRRRIPGYPAFYQDSDSGQQHTNLAYLLYPLLFKKEIDAGKIVVLSH